MTAGITLLVGGTIPHTLRHPPCVHTTLALRLLERIQRTRYALRAWFPPNLICLRTCSLVVRDFAAG
jgi:hypothetical protein